MKLPRRWPPVLPVLLGFLFGLTALAPWVSAQTYLYNQAAVATGTKPVAVVAADLNGDGRLDLAVVNQTDNTVSVVLSKSDGSFASKVDYKVGAAPIAIVSGRLQWRPHSGPGGCQQSGQHRFYLARDRQRDILRPGNFPYWRDAGWPGGGRF
jgi:hypothetical protein